MAGLTPATANSPPFSLGPSLAPTFDLLELLPPAAADRLRALRQRSTDAHALIPAFEAIHTASLEKIEAANALRQLTDHPHHFGHNLASSDPRVIAAQKRLDKLTADAKRLAELQEVRTAAWQAASGALQSVDAWLRDGRPPATLLEPDETAPPKLTKGETLEAAIERLRRRARELRADAHRIQSSPFPSSYAKRRMREQLEALAVKGAPSVSRLVELDGPVDFQTRRLQSEVIAEKRALAFTEVADAVALIAWLHRDALIAALDREIANEADDAVALSHEAREKAEAELTGDLLEIERQEASLVWQAQAQALPIEHRADCAPAAILGVVLVVAPRAAPSGTSPGHAWNVAGAGRR